MKKNNDAIRSLTDEEMKNISGQIFNGDKDNAEGLKKGGVIAGSICCIVCIAVAAAFFFPVI